MSGQSHLPSRLTLFALGIAAMTAACNDPTKPSFEAITPDGEEICEASDDWLPSTPPLPQFLPVPHPAGECPFYRSGWQNFLTAMQPDAQGKPAMLGYPSVDSVFIPTKPHPASRSYLGDIKQAGARQILVDQNGNTLFYGIAINDEFAKFIKDNDLGTAEKLKAYPTTHPNLTFPAGVVEFKSAWQVVEGDIAAQTQNYISMQTTVPTLTQDAAGNIHEDRNTPRQVTVRLLAIHVVSTLVGHPEFIWASFEHSTAFASNDAEDVKAADGYRDLAPIGPDDLNPDPVKLNRDVTKPADDTKDYILYKKGTPTNVGNHPFDAENMMKLVAGSQKFMDGTTPQETSIYRMFPASKSNTTEPDPAITSLNHNVGKLFHNARMDGRLAANDKRGNYRLVGAQWMDKPMYFDRDIPIQNDPTTSPMTQTKHIAQDGSTAEPVSKATFDASLKLEGSDSEFSILAGEDRMSSVAMESFTQAPGAFNNCFTCHNTQGITANGVPSNKDSGGIVLLPPGLLNVSHVLSQYLLEEYEDAHPATP